MKDVRVLLAFTASNNSRFKSCQRMALLRNIGGIFAFCVDHPGQRMTKWRQERTQCSMNNCRSSAAYKCPPDEGNDQDERCGFVLCEACHLMLASEQAAELDNDGCDDGSDVSAVTTWKGVHVRGAVIWNTFGRVLARPTTLHKKAMDVVSAIFSRVQGLSSTLYMEALLFPQIFWHQDPSGAFTGMSFDLLAMLTFSSGALPLDLMANTSGVTIGLDSLSNHVWSRLCRPYSFTATDPDYRGLCFDWMFNVHFKDRDSRFIFSRGAESILDPLGDGISDDFLKTTGFASSRSRELPFAEYDSTRAVSELCAAAKQHGLSHFFTLSLNQASFPGVRIWYNLLQEHALPRESFLVDLCRIWERSSRLLLDWLEHGEELPLGAQVTNIWARYEFQTAEAHPPHLHVFFSVAGEPDGYKSATTASVAELHAELSRLQFLSQEEVMDFCDWSSKVLAHDCEKGRHRCTYISNEDGSKRCKVQPRPVTETHDFEVKVPHYDREFTDLLEEMGLAQRDPNGDHLTLDPVLLDGKWTYPSDGGSTTKMSPFSPILFFAVGGSHINLQLTGGYHGVVGYATKYAAGEEERAIVTHSGSFSGETAPQPILEVGEIVNTKINHLKADYRTKFRSRFVSESEMVWFTLGLPYVISTFHWIHLDCRPADLRPQKLRRDRGSNRPEGGAEEMEDQLTEIQDATIPADRAAYSSQIRRLSDLVCSGYAADNVALFDLRPVEVFLLFDNATQFHKHCVVVKKGVSKLSFKDRALEEIRNVGLHCINGYQVLFREEFLHEVPFLQGWDNIGHEVQQIVELLLQTEDKTADIYRRFVRRLHNGRRCSVFVQKAAHPNSKTNFLLHFLLRFGNYESELSLFYEGNCRTMRDLYNKAGLLGNASDRACVLQLLKTYFHECLTETCAAAKELQRLLFAAEDCFRSLFNDAQENAPLPPVLQTDFEQIIYDEFKSSQRDIFNHLVRAIKDEIPAFPYARVLADFEGDYDERIRLPTSWERVQFSFERGSGMWRPPVADITTPEGVAENIRARDRILRLVEDDVEISKPFYVYIGGEPGTGKTYTMQEIAGVLLTRGFRNVVLTTTAAQRALDKGGVHLAELFGFHVYPSFDHENPVKVAYNALRTLQRHPVRLLRLCQLEILLWEEVGLESCRKLHSIDVVLRTLRCNCQPFGGVSIIASGHHMQLPSSAKGMQLFESPHFLYTFNVFLLRKMIRLREPAHQEIVDKLCKPLISPEQAAELSRRIMHTITSVAQWEEVPLDTVVVFGMKDAVAAATVAMLKRREEAGTEVHRHRSIDEVKLPHGFVVTGSTSHRAALSKKLKEPDLLEIYVGCPVMMTRNHVIPGIFHGARGTVVQIHSEQGVLKQVEVLWTRGNNDDIVSVVKPNYSCEVCPKPRLTLRRFQFPLRTVFAQTYHSVQGAQVPSIATTLTTTGRRRVWLRQQLIVLLSRARDMATQVFNVLDGVGYQQVESELTNLIQKRTQWLENVDHVLQERNQLRAQDNVRNRLLDQGHDAYVARPEVALPTTRVQGVYMISSLSGHIYVGYSTDVSRRVQRHKEELGAVELRGIGTLRLLAMVTEMQETDAKQLEIWAHRHIGRRPVSQRAAINSFCEYAELHFANVRIDHV